MAPESQLDLGIHLLQVLREAVLRVGLEKSPQLRHAEREAAVQDRRRAAIQLPASPTVQDGQCDMPNEEHEEKQSAGVIHQSAVSALISHIFETTKTISQCSSSQMYNRKYRQTRQCMKRDDCIPV